MLRSAVAVALALAAPSASSPRLLGIEHVPIAVGDLDRAAALFRAIGFTIKPGRFHVDGIRNAHVKFADGSYLELITAPAATDPLTATYRRMIAAGDGPAFASLYVTTLDGLADRLAPLGARLSDGGVDFPAGSLAPFFFGTRRRSPSDRADFYHHANGALGIERLWLAPDDPGPIRRLVTKLGGRWRVELACLARCECAAVARLPSGSIALLAPERQRLRGRPIVAVTVRVSDLAAPRRALLDAHSPVDTGGVVELPGHLLVYPWRASGLWLDFSAGSAQDRTRPRPLRTGTPTSRVRCASGNS